MIDYKSMPSKAKIARYWLDKKLPNGDLVIEDWLEPCCWACGIWEYDENEEKLIEEENFTDTWNYNANYLERCHIIPRALGGRNSEDNLFLMCKTCHEDSPDTTHKELFFDWVMKRSIQDMLNSHWVSKLHKELLDREINIEEFTQWYKEDSNRITNAKDTMNSHAFKIVENTYVAGYLGYYLENKGERK